MDLQHVQHLFFTPKLSSLCTHTTPFNTQFSIPPFSVSHRRIYLVQSDENLHTYESTLDKPLVRITT